ncbi:MAG: hypothetical protein LBD96_11880, partial [Treponema sp.]|nr:hypothetical protein [Treponema sp.]
MVKRTKTVKILIIRGFPKTSVFGKATLDLEEKADFWPLFPKLFPKLTEFWEQLQYQSFYPAEVRSNQIGGIMRRFLYVMAVLTALFTQV